MWYTTISNSYICIALKTFVPKDYFKNMEIIKFGNKETSVTLVSFRLVVHL